MYVTSLTVKKAESWEKDAGALCGTLIMEGDRGKQEIKLSSMAISRIMGVIASEVIDTSRENAQRTRHGMDEAVHSAVALESVQMPQLGSEEIPF